MSEVRIAHEFHFFSHMKEGKYATAWYLGLLVWLRDPVPTGEAGNAPCNRQACRTLEMFPAREVYS